MRYSLILVLATVALPAAAQVPLVLTDIPPVNALVAQVMGSLGTPVQLLERGADEHDLHLRPSQVRALNAAQLLVWVGPELTPGLETVVQSAPAALRSLALLDDPATRHRSFADGAGTDPHAWLDPANAAIWLTLIAGELAQLDPGHTSQYQSNAEAARKDLTDLDARLSARFAAVQTRAFVTYHDAYGYFASHYALNYAGALARGDAGPPGAARISALQDIVASAGVRCAFPEAQHDPALLTQFTADGIVKLGAALDPVGALLDPGPMAYAALLTNLADAIITCLVP